MEEDQLDKVHRFAHRSLLETKQQIASHLLGQRQAIEESLKEKTRLAKWVSSRMQGRTRL